MSKITFILSPMDSPYKLQKTRLLLQEIYGEKVIIDIFDTYKVQDDKTEYESCLKSIENSVITMVFMHGGMNYFKKLEDILDLCEGKSRFFIHSGIEDENPYFFKRSSLSSVDYAKILKYYKVGDHKNLAYMCGYIAHSLDAADLNVTAPQTVEWEGVYLGGGMKADQPVRYMSQIKNQGKPVVGILFYSNFLRDNNLEHIEAFMEAIKKSSAIPVAIFTSSAPDLSIGNRGFEWTRDNLLMNNKGQANVDVVINTMAHAQSILANPGDGRQTASSSIFDKVGLPVIQALTTFQDYDTWKKSLRGVDNMSFTGSVCFPEFDGQIITVTAAYSQMIDDDLGKRMVYRPIKDRIQKISDLAVNWARLSHIKNEDKKVAVIFHNMPPKNDKIGCAFGLDTPQSVYYMIKAMEENGIKVDQDYENGDEIIYKIIDAVSNDTRWLTAEKVLEKSIDHIRKDQYEAWFENLAPVVKERLSKDWGKAPGEFMVYKDLIPVPGILNGNVFIGLQPARGFLEKADEVYHSTEIMPPHSYIAYYRWIRDVFEADVVIHIGTHGSLEWLPGKEIGLSEECYPDIAIDSMPHLYPYIVNVLGEGIQAKRRSYAVILDHLIPSLVESGVYDDMEDIDALMKQYFQTKQSGDGKLTIIKDQLIELIIENHFHEDLKTSIEAIHNDFDSFICKLQSWIDEIKETLIKDGLHIFGQVPKDERYDNLVHSLLKLPEKMLRQDMQGYSEKTIEKLINEKRDLIRDKLNGTTDEMKHLIEGINGRFVPAGSGGSPSRDRLDVLPTGRNFYSIDPSTIPTRAAWEVGVQYGDQIIERYLEEEGSYPEQITIVIYAGETMKTGGDDIAQVMYLMGVKPRWLENSDKVIGFEIISTDQLRRPRIDVTMRITGLFRDTFPLIIEYVEEAINEIATLEESHDVNYIKKHVDQEIKMLTDEGLDFDQASDEARMRIFGCPPGTYGAGVDILIESKNWTSSDDLGQVYTLWSGNAYGKKLHGDKLTDVFARRLASTQITVKNESSMEIDMLEDDCYFNYHGGMIAGVKKYAGQTPKSYTGDSSNPSAVKVHDIKETTAKIMRSRILNPKWFEGLMKHGYKGAQDISFMMDIVFGWDATANLIDDWMYDQISDQYIRNKKRREQMEKANPWAVHNMLEKLLEAHQRGMWKTEKNRLEDLRNLYMDIEGNIEETL